MLVVPFRRPQDVLHLKVEIQQGRVGFGVGIVFQPVLQGSRQRPQRGQQGRGQFFAEHRAVLSVVGGGQLDGGRLRRSRQ